MTAPLTITSVAVIAGLLGSAITSGIYFGRMERLLTEHERRLNGQDAHMSAIDGQHTALTSDLSYLKAQVGYLVREAQAGGMR